MYIHPVRAFPTRQRGVVLAVGLILLLVMSLVMIVAMSGSILQERMAGAVRNESIAIVGADSALRDGELMVWNRVVAASGQATFAEPTSTAVRQFRTQRDWVPGGFTYGASGSGKTFSNNDYFMMAQTPSFMIEQLGEVGLGSGEQEKPESHGGSTLTSNESLFYYRITGRSTGGTEGVVRVAESTFSVGLYEN